MLAEKKSKIVIFSDLKNYNLWEKVLLIYERKCDFMF